MAQVTRSTVLELLDSKPFRVLQGGKQLTLALGGLYIVSTTSAARPQLVWETEQSYPRYYVPVESLHQDIQATLTGADHSSISLQTVDTISSNRNTGETAIIEKLSIGSRDTTWVRFIEGPRKGLIRFERSELDDWFEDGKLFAGIKNPFKRIDTAAISRHIVVKVEGEIVAETNVAVALYETNSSETYYIPATAIKDWGSIEKSSLRTACPYKGEAWYLSITVNGRKHDNLIWYYQYPTHESAGVEGLIAFYRKDFVDITVDGSPI